MSINAISILAGCAACAVLLFAGPAAAEGNAANGEKLYAVCSACHGPDGGGNRALNSPRIQGQSPWYLTRQLEYFKAGVRGANSADIYGAQMRPMAMTLSDDQAIADVTAYMTSLDAQPPAGTVEGNLEKGKSAYAVCTACHGAKGEGNKVLNAPRLAGQADWYIVTQLKNYKSGARGAHDKDTTGAQMRPMAMTLATDEAVNDVAAYIATLQ